MKEIKFEEWPLWVDYNVTKATYDSAKPDACDCDNCKNFRLVGLSVYPETVLQLFLELGIDPLKHAELSYIRF